MLDINNFVSELGWPYLEILYHLKIPSGSRAGDENFKRVEDIASNLKLEFFSLSLSHPFLPHPFCEEGAQYMLRCFFLVLSNIPLGNSTVTAYPINCPTPVEDDQLETSDKIVVWVSSVDFYIQCRERLGFFCFFLHLRS